jgi:hypothetical protein
MSQSSSSSASVAALIFVGVILTFLGIFAAGSLELIVIGVVALFGAGLFQTLAARAR